MSNVSAIIPTTLAKRPDGALWLDRAVKSVLAQTTPPREVLVAVDPGVELPRELVASFAERYVADRGMSDCPIRTIQGEVRGHHAAVNAAAKAARGLYLAFLEDDDFWQPEHLDALQTARLHYGTEFVTASQLAVSADGDERGDFHFATMSSWLIAKGCWERIGGLDPRFWAHTDNEFLGRFSRSHFCRIHLAPAGSDLAHPWLREIARRCAVEASLERFTVLRTLRGDSLMGGMAGGQSPERSRQSGKEMVAFEVLFGAPPW